MTTYDAIIIGGGHNGLVCAGYLAKAGRRVLVLERRSIVGGAAVTEEFYPGFRVDSLSHDAWLDPSIVGDLGLARQGLELLPDEGPIVSLLPGGERLELWPDPRRAAEAIRRFSPHDAGVYPEFAGLAAKFASVVGEAQHTIPPEIIESETRDLFDLARLGVRARALGGKEMVALLRALPMPIAEYLGEWFECGPLMGALASLGLDGIFHGPYAAGTTFLFLNRMALGGGRIGPGRQVRGGVGALTKTIASAAGGFGAEVRTQAEVSRVVMRDGRVAGVELANGEVIHGRVVVSNLDPRRTFFGLVDPMELEPGFVRALRNFRYRGATAKVHLALDRPPAFAGDGRAAFLIAPDPEGLERAFEDAKYGRLSSRPFLDMRLQTAADPSCAPPGKHVLSIRARFAPYRLSESNWETQREALADAVVGLLSEHDPGIASAVLHRHVLAPPDLERIYGLTEGSESHGEMMLDQLFFMRPVPGWAQHRTPLHGLYLCGAGTHPGGGVHGLCGRNAAKAVMRDK